MNNISNGWRRPRWVQFIDEKLLGNVIHPMALKIERASEPGDTLIANLGKFSLYGRRSNRVIINSTPQEVNFTAKSILLSFFGAQPTVRLSLRGEHENKLEFARQVYAYDFIKAIIFLIIVLSSVIALAAVFVSLARLLIPDTFTAFASAKELLKTAFLSVGAGIGATLFYRTLKITSFPTSRMLTKYTDNLVVVRNSEF